jgi:ribosomal protein S18 acetylase RimI-like enzyme
MAAFPHSALTLMGSETVHRYYHWQMTGPHEEVIALGVFEGDRLIGFIFGGFFHGSLSGFLRQNRAFLLWRILTRFWLLANPEFRRRTLDGFQVIRRVRNGRVLSPAANTMPARPPAPAGSKQHASYGLLSLAVHPQFQGRGAGKRLMLEAEAVARRAGYPEMHLTVEPHNWKAIRLYEAIGWEKVPASPHPRSSPTKLQSEATATAPWNGKMRKILEPNIHSPA